MKYFVMSDIHIDFYIDLWNNHQPIKEYNESVPIFEKFYDLYMLPADAIISAGDFANDFYTEVNFMRWLSTKYKQCYLTFGNHDLGVVGHTFGNGNPQNSSEKRMKETKDAVADLKNVHILEGEVVDGIGGCMGMCDFSERASLDMGFGYRVNNWHHWYDGKVWRYMNEYNGQFGKMNPMKIWQYYSDMMNAILDQHPKIMVTHFVPSEVGIQWEFRNSSTNAYFYFKGEKFLDKMDTGSYWISGHIHGILTNDYTTKSGQLVHLMTMPQGYPGENPYVADVKKFYTKDSRIIEI